MLRESYRITNIVSIKEPLQQSEGLVLLASPQSARVSR
jgi:hypothetical protein